MIRENIEKLSPSRLRASFVVDGADVDDALLSARELVEDLKRRPLGEKQVGKNVEETAERAVRTRATRALVERAVKQAVEAGGMRLSSNPKADIDVLVEPGKPYEFSLELNVVPQFELSSYEPVEIEVSDDFSVSEAEVEARLEEIRGRSAEVKKDSDEPVGETDIVELSFESFIDGESYEGNSASGFSYTMGSGHLPQGFEDGLLGLRTGDEKTIEFTIPSDYENSEIAGKTARFDVRVGRVASCRLPDVDDAFAESFGYEGLAAWKEKIARELSQGKESRYQGECEAYARQALARRLVGAPDGSMIEAQAESMFAAFKADLEQQGVQFAECCRFLGLTEDAVRAEMREESEVILKENLALESLFRHCGLKVTDAEVQRTADALAEESGAGESLSLSTLLPQQQDALREMTMHRLATERLLDEAVFLRASQV